MYLTATGILRYEPRAASIESRPWWTIVQCSADWYRMYSYWLSRHLDGEWMRVVDRDRINADRRSVDLTPRLAYVRPTFMCPAWLPHISVNRGEPPKNRAVWRKYEGRKITFEFDMTPRWNEQHIWLPVRCREIEDIRVELGLAPQPRVPLHLTVAVFGEVGS